MILFSLVSVVSAGIPVKVNSSGDFNFSETTFKVISLFSLFAIASCNALSPGVTSFTFNSTSNS